MERLVRKAQRGDKNAFMALIEKNQLALYRAAKAILHREEDVEDAVQETICKAFYKLSDLRQPKYFKTWLTRILINCCYDLLRQKKGLVPLEILPEEGASDERETSLDVQRVLAELGTQELSPALFSLLNTANQISFTHGFRLGVSLVRWALRG